jgi:hypothetical protein
MKTSNTYVITATDADGVCESQTPLGVGALTMDGALASSGIVTIPTGQHVTITCGGADAGRTFTIVGLDGSGNALTATQAGADNGTTTSTVNFSKITSVSVDAATAGAITVGIVATCETPWIPLNTYNHPFVYGYQVDIGTASFTVQGTLDSVQDSSITPLEFTVTASALADAYASVTTPMTAVRLKVTAWTSGDIVFKVLQSGI